MNERDQRRRRRARSACGFGIRRRTAKLSRRARAGYPAVRRSGERPGSPLVRTCSLIASSWRRRRARPASSFLEKPGMLEQARRSRVGRAWRAPCRSRRSRVALRGARSSSARSPKKPPGPSSATFSAVALDPGLAVEDHEELGAGGALGDDHGAGRDVHRLGRFATSWSSFLEQAEKRGTVARVSTNESLRAMDEHTATAATFVAQGMASRCRKLE